MGFRCATINANKLAEQLGVNIDDLNVAIRNSRIGGIARLWSFEDKGNFGTGRISVSSKKDQNSDYETQFQDGFTCFSGAAYEHAKSMNIPENGVSIIILNCDVRNKFDSKTKKMYTNFYIYDFDTFSGTETKQENKPKAAPTKKDGPVDSDGVEVEDEELPF